jgi:hypothetical protein
VHPGNLVIPPTSETATDESDGGETENGAWFLQTFFPNSYALSGFGACYRPDVMDSPEQPFLEKPPTVWRDKEEALGLLEGEHGLREYQASVLQGSERRALKSGRKKQKQKEKEKEREREDRAKEMLFGAGEEEKKCDLETSLFGKMDMSQFVGGRGGGKKKGAAKTTATMMTQTKKPTPTPTRDGGTQTDEAVAAVVEVTKAETELEAEVKQEEGGGGLKSAVVGAVKWGALCLAIMCLAAAILINGMAASAGGAGGEGGGGGLAGSAAIAECAAAPLPLNARELAAPPPPPPVAASVMPHWVKVGESISLGGTEHAGRVAYRWLKDGEVIEGAAGPFLSVSEAEEQHEGVYTRLASVRQGHLDDEEEEEVEEVEAEGGRGEGGGAEVVVNESSTEIKVSKKPTVKNNPGYYNVQAGSKLMLSVSAEGLPPPSFRWRLNGVDIDGAVDPVLVVDRVANADRGTYTCDVYNIAGNVLWEEAIVDVV